MSQSNTKVGDIRVLAGESLVGKEGYLVKMTHDGGVPEVKLPAAVTDYLPYVVIEGAADAALCTVRPLEPGRSFRIALKGAVSPGAAVVPAAIAGSDAGKIITIPASATNRVLGIAEETGADGQLVRVRALHLGLVTVA